MTTQERISIEESNSQLESDEIPASKEALTNMADELRSAMEDAARALDFEEAARLRDRLLTIEDRLRALGD